MKNIHLLPTDKPSRLYKTGNFLLLDSKAMPNNTLETKNQNIYITNDSEIKVGDWYYLPRTNYIYKCIEDPTGLNLERRLGVAKIILTTDQDLIKDGVQAIDDTFLEWFVKNPSCEFVDVSTYHVQGDISGKLHYKIIIPQEEPKQEFLEKISSIDLSPEFQQLISDNLDDLTSYEPKQETLEEAAEIWVNNRFTKQICGNESYPDIHASKERIVESHIIFAKWQSERMYSEEEVLELLLKSKIETSNLYYEDMKEWFEQSKKK
jgi:hypothetical protein